jgi:hypothetical protein
MYIFRACQKEVVGPLDPAICGLAVKRSSGAACATTMSMTKKWVCDACVQKRDAVRPNALKAVEERCRNRAWWTKMEAKQFLGASNTCRRFPPLPPKLVAPNITNQRPTYRSRSITETRVSLGARCVESRYSVV